MIWREKRILLIVLGVLLLANAVFFFTYRVQYEERLHDLAGRRAEAEQQLEKAHNTRVAAERQYAAYRKIEHDVEDIYVNKWATQAQRLSPMIVEVKRLAVASQLVPQTYSFSQIQTKSDSAGALGTDIVGISFTVQGSYEQVRRLVNLLELSEQFAIVDQISLSSSSADPSKLTVNVHVKTLFRDPNVQSRIGNKEL